MRLLGYTLSYMLVLILAAGPLYLLTTGITLPFVTPTTLAAVNLLGWCGVLVFLLSRFDFRRKVNIVAKSIGIDTRFKSFDTLLNTLIRELARKNEAFAINLVEKKITSKKELSRALESIVAIAYKLLKAESAELALFDPESGMYHSSFVLGKPFRSSSQAMLSNAVEGKKEEIDPEVLVQPITFAGSIFGSLRVALKQGNLPSSSDREVMKLLALQGGVAIINAEFTDKVIQMRRASDETVKAKTGFLANLSHEIRGPLGIMLNAVELVLDGLCGEVTQDQIETLGMVKGNGEHLLELINDVLDYAKVESGRIMPQKVEVLLDEILKDIIGVVRKQAEAKNHKLVYKPNSEALAINCDRRHLRQMLINMLTNAIKYTPDGGSIEVWAERVPVNKVRISVKDSGVGIEEANRYKVFAAFERIENSYSIAQVGTGLGMPLTKKLAEVNGGLIDFRSAPNRGSHFWLVFPTIELNSSMLLHKKEEKPEASGKGEVILLVERDPGEQAMLRRYLSHIGFEVVASSSKLEALDVLRNRIVELTIIDNNVADSQSEDILAGFRENAKKNSMPILLITSRGFAFDIEKYLKSGIDRCLIKPIELKQLGSVCRELIDGTYSGAVIDSSELETAQSSKVQSAKEGENAGTRLLELDDLLH